MGKHGQTACLELWTRRHSQLKARHLVFKQLGAHIRVGYLFFITSQSRPSSPPRVQLNHIRPIEMRHAQAHAVANSFATPSNSS